MKTFSTQILFSQLLNNKKMGMKCSLGTFEKKSVKKKGVVKQIYIPLVFVVGLLLLKSHAYLYSLCFVVGPYERMVAAFTHCHINSCGKDSKAFLIELHHNKDLLFLFLFLFVQLG